jgi:hypothetical protein
MPGQVGLLPDYVVVKKYMWSEIWSLIAYVGTPLWYITLSPADNRHPLCLYFADSKEQFDINLSRTEDERYRLITSNPVAGAHFFDFMVRMFIKHILGVDSENRVCMVTLLHIMVPSNNRVS